MKVCENSKMFDNLEDISKDDLIELVKKLKECEEKYRSIVEETNNLITKVDPAGNFTYINKVSEKIFGLSPEECIGRPAFDFIYHEDKQDTLEAFNKWVSEKRDKVSFENRQVHKNGKITHMLWTSNLHYDESGNLLWVDGIARDITDRVKGEERLNYAQKIAKVGSWDWDVKTNKLWWSDETFRIFGFKPQGFEPNYEIFEKILHPDDKDRVNESVKNALEKNIPYNIENRIVLPSGEERWINSQGEVTRDENGDPVKFEGVQIDITERKKAEEKIKRSETLLKASLESPKEMIVFSIDKNFNYLYLNSFHKKATSHVYGKEIDVGSNMLDHMTDLSDRAKAKRNFERAFSGESHTTIEEYGELERNYYETRYNPIYDENGSVIGASALSSNITKRVRSEEQLKASELRYKNLFENLTTGFALHEIVLDDGGKPVDYIFKAVNATFENLTGLKRENLIDRKVTEALPGIEKDPADWIGTYGNVVLSGESITFENYAEPLDKWFSVTAYKHSEDHFATIFTDITESKRNLEELNASKSHLEARFRLINADTKSIQEYLDLALDEAISLSGSELGYIYFYSEKDKLFTLNSWSKKVLPNCKVVNAQTTYELNKTGFWGEAVRQRGPILLNDFKSPHPLKKGYPEGHAPLSNFMSVPIVKGGKIIAVAGVANKPNDYTKADINSLTSFMDLVFNDVEIKKGELEKKEMQKSLFLTSKLAQIGELAAGVAHEINNPLAILNGNIEIIKRLCKCDNKDIKESLLYSEEEVDRIKNIIDNLNEFSRSNDDSQSVTDVKKSVSKVLKLISEIYSKENVKLKTSFKAKDHFVFASEEMLRQVILNLLSNAKDAMGKNGGEILIKTNVEGEAFKLEISDNGDGISEEDLDNIFNLFYTTKDVGKGTGLGLSIAKSIINSFNGDITVSSQVGVGSSFTITLPLAKETELERNTLKSSEQTPKKLSGRALIIDDEVGLRRVLKVHLVTEGLEVVEASNGLEAMEIVRKVPFDIIFLDLKMPNMTGNEFIKKMEEEGVKIPKIVIITGCVLNEYTDNELEVLKQKYPVFKKPFKYEEIDKILSE